MVRPAGTKPLARAVALPAEHGGWSLTLEPVVLGLLVAPSAAGWLLGAAAFLGFLARTPLKLALVDRWRKRRLDRTILAERVAAVEIAALGGALVGAAVLGDAALWLPLALAAPLFGVELWFDARSRGRRLVPELAGSVGMGAFAAAIALAGGEARLLAFGLWAVVAARAMAAMPFVRVQLRRAKGQPHSTRHTDAAQAVAVAVAWAGAAVGAVPAAGAIAVTVLAAVHLVAARRAPPPAPVLGAQQVALGLGVVVATALGARAP